MLILRHIRHVHILFTSSHFAKLEINVSYLEKQMALISMCSIC